MVKISKSLAKSSEKDMTRIFNPMLIAMVFKKYFGFEFPGKPSPPLSQLIICLSTIRHTISLPLKRHQIEDVKVLWKREIQELMSLKLVSSFSFESEVLDTYPVSPRSL